MDFDETGNNCDVLPRSAHSVPCLPGSYFIFIGGIYAKLIPILPTNFSAQITSYYLTASNHNFSLKFGRSEVIIRKISWSGERREKVHLPWWRLQKARRVDSSWRCGEAFVSNLWRGLLSSAEKECGFYHITKPWFKGAVATDCGPIWYVIKLKWFYRFKSGKLERTNQGQLLQSS